MEHLYAGFWIRTLAALIDSGILLIVLLPIIFWTNPQVGSSHVHFTLVQNLAINLTPLLLAGVFWRYYEATPGKMLLSLAVVDLTTGQRLSLQQCLIRTLGYIFATLPLCAGFIWIAFDAKKQGWHDKLAGSVVLRRSPIARISAL